MISSDSYHIVIQLAPSQTVSDYRLSNIQTTSIDSPNCLSMSSETVEPIRAKLLGQGIIRLYREYYDESDSKELSVEDDVILPGDGLMVSILAVPTYFTATDLLGFIGETNMKHISHIRILKSEKPNRFLVLIKFIDPLQAAQFQYDFNGKAFNSMEPESCHVVFIKSVKVDGQINKLCKKSIEDMIPFLLQDPFTSTESSSSQHKNILVELPTCPVCLERMDATVTGLLTIPCQHTFHCQCLSKWTDDTCPVCRYSNNVSNQKVRRTIRRLLQLGAGSSGTGSTITQDSREHCFSCDAEDDLWICLICGNVGCSRYAPQQHSLKHFIDTGHCFAMESTTSRVWDYAGDNYVHRLVTNESDGKLVELPDKNSTSNESKSDGNFDKVDEVGFEYSQLLISQLASQREYYEQLLAEKEFPKTRKDSVLSNGRLNLIVSNVGSLSETDLKMKELEKRMNDITESIIPGLKSKIALKDEKIKIISKDLSEAKSLNEALSNKVEFINESNSQLKKEIKKLTEENTGLNEQVTDLMFFLDNQEKFKDASQEVKDGKLIIQPKASPKSKSHRKRK